MNNIQLWVSYKYFYSLIFFYFSDIETFMWDNLQHLISISIFNLEIKVLNPKIYLILAKSLP